MRFKGGCKLGGFVDACAMAAFDCGIGTLGLPVGSVVKSTIERFNLLVPVLGSKKSLEIVEKYKLVKGSINSLIVGCVGDCKSVLVNDEKSPVAWLRLSVNVQALWILYKVIMHLWKQKQQNKIVKEEEVDCLRKLIVNASRFQKVSEVRSISSGRVYTVTTTIHLNMKGVPMIGSTVSTITSRFLRRCYHVNDEDAARCHEQLVKKIIMGENFREGCVNSVKWNLIL